MSSASELASIAAVRQRLASKYMHLPENQVAAAVEQAYGSFIASPVRDFVPLLVERRAKTLLESMTV